LSTQDDALSTGPVSAEFGQKNSVEIFVTAFDRCLRSAKVYSYESGGELLGNIFDNVLGALEKALQDDEVIDLHIKPLQLFYQRKMVYENKDKKKSLAYLLFENGIRLLSFKRGLQKEELIELIYTCSQDFTSPELMDEDLYCSIFEKNFQNIEVVGFDFVAEEQKSNSELTEKLEVFVERVKSKRLTPRPHPERRLRDEDLEVLKKFPLSTSQFSKSEEEVAKMIKSTLVKASGAKQDRSTLEKLSEMGFYFFSQENRPDHLKVGRDLLVQIGMMILEQAFFDMFEGFIRKIHELQRNNLSRKYEYQEIIDRMFGPEQYRLYRDLVQSPSHQRELINILTKAPARAVRLIILLLPAQPSLYKIFGEFILQHLPHETPWLFETVEKQPDLEAWEHLVNVLAARPTPQYSAFILHLMNFSGETLKVKLLRQCAVMGTTESIDIFRRILKEDNYEKRKIALDVIAQAKSRAAIVMLKSFIESEEFETLETDLKEKSYSNLLRMAGDVAYPWFEQLWFKKHSGLFKAKSIHQTRCMLIRAAFASHPVFLKRVLSQDASDLSVDLKEMISKGFQSLGEGRAGS
jgi:hypothetical protein